jgi:hypothetical protein
LVVSKRTSVSLLRGAVVGKAESSFNEVRGFVEMLVEIWVNRGGVFGCRDNCLSGGRIVVVRWLMVTSLLGGWWCQWWIQETAPPLLSEIGLRKVETGKRT